MEVRSGNHSVNRAGGALKQRDSRDEEGNCTGSFLASRSVQYQ